MGCIRKSVLIATAINCGRSAGSGGSSGFGGCAAVEFRENFHDSRRRPRVDGGWWRPSGPLPRPVSICISCIYGVTICEVE